MERTYMKTTQIITKLFHRSAVHRTVPAMTQVDSPPSYSNKTKRNWTPVCVLTHDSAPAGVV